MAAVAPTKSNGAEALLDQYLASLAVRPVLTKGVTSGSVLATQEILSSALTGVPVLQFIDRGIKMYLYGFLVAAPIGHQLTTTQQKVFAGKTGLPWTILQMLSGNLIISPIQNSVYLMSMAVLAGRYKPSELINSLRLGLYPMMRVTWMINPPTQLIAVNFIPMRYWVVFYNFVGFMVGFLVSVRAKFNAKRAREAAAKKGLEAAKSNGQKEE